MQQGKWLVSWCDVTVTTISNCFEKAQYSGNEVTLTPEISIKKHTDDEDW